MANNFTNDSNCVALWRFESGAITTDSVGGNTLTNVNAVSNNTSSYKEGSACAEFAGGATQQHLKILDADLDSGFPLKSGDTTKKISVCAWFKSDTSAYETVFSSRDYDNLNSFSFTFHGTHNLAIGYNSGADSEVLSSGTTINTGTWYHVGFTFDNADKSWKLIVWNDSTGSKVIDASGTATNNISATTAPFAIGCLFSSGALSQGFDGLIDEVVVFKDILTESEIDAIRAGTYNVLDTSAWANNLELTIDHDKIDSDLEDFPVTIQLNSSSGITDVDVTAVFDELTSDANRKKIAVTDSSYRQLFVEIEKWDDANEQAVLHVKVPEVSSSSDTTLYLFYDSTQPDNTSFVGDTTDAVTHNVWDSNFEAVYHMAQDPNGDSADCIKDSTVNANDGTPSGSMTTADLVSGKVGDGIDFDGSDDYIGIGTSLNSLFTRSDSFSVFVCSKTSSATAQYPVSNSDMSDPYAGFSLYEEADGDLAFELVQSSSKLLRGTNTNTLGDGSWHHLGATYGGGDAATLTMYVDGSSVSYSTDYDTLDSDVSSVADLTIGVRDASYGFFNGVIDEVRISSTVRSAAWVKATYHSLWDSLITMPASGTEYPASISENTTTGDTFDVETPYREFSENLELSDVFAAQNYTARQAEGFTTADAIIVTKTESSGANNGVRSNFNKASGKWYFEVTIDDGSHHHIGIATEHAGLNDFAGADQYAYSYGSDGKKWTNGGGLSYGDTYGPGDIIGVALDLDNHEIYFSKNGVWQDSGDPDNGTDPAYTIDSGTYYAIWSALSVAEVTANFDGPFAYSIPTGFLSFGSGSVLCTWDCDKIGSEIAELSCGITYLTAKTLSSGEYFCFYKGSGLATLGKLSGKWYFEAEMRLLVEDMTELWRSNARIGISGSAANLEQGIGQTDQEIALSADGNLRTDAQFSNICSELNDGDVVGVALDLDEQKIWFSVNGVWLDDGDPENGTAPAATFPAAKYYPAGSAYTYQDYQNPVSRGYRFSQAQILARFDESFFAYTPPEGFLPYDSPAINYTVWDETHTGASEHSSVGISNKSLSIAPGSTTLNFSDLATSIGTVGHLEGKYYFETEIYVYTTAYDSYLTYPQASVNPTVPGGLAVGLANGDVNINESIAYSSDAVAESANVTFGYDVDPAAGGIVFPHRETSKTIGVAVDFDSEEIWFSNDGIWSGSPVDGTGGTSISSIAGTDLYPSATIVSKNEYSNLGGSLSEKTLASTAALRTDSESMSYPVPDGFTAWDEDPNAQDPLDQFSTEYVALSDAITAGVEYGSGVWDELGETSEVVTLSDSVYAELPGETEIPESGVAGESFTVSDTIEAQTPNGILAEDVTLSDEFILDTPYRDLEEDASLSDTFSTADSEINPTQSEDVELTDTYVAGFEIEPVYSGEDVTTADAVSVDRELAIQYVSEQVSSSDSISANKEKGDSVTTTGYISDEVGWQWGGNVAESSAEFSDAVSIEVTWPVSEWLKTQETVVPNWSGTITVNENLFFLGQSILIQVFNDTATSVIDATDTVSMLHKMISVALSSMELADTVSPQMSYNPAIVESIAVAGALSVIATLNLTSSESVAFADLPVFQWDESVISTMAVADTAAIVHYCMMVIADSMVATDTAVSQLLVNENISETLEYAATIAIQQMLQMSVTEDLTFSLTVSFDDEVWECWVLSTNAFHPSVYSNFNFNSYAVFNDQAFGCKEDGIYRLDGATDDGTAINAGIVLPETAFGTSRQKRFRKAYFGLSGTSPSIRMETESGNVTYNISNNRANIGRNQKGQQWTLKVQGYDDMDFIELVPIILTR
jgi:hypothetical protein